MSSRYNTVAVCASLEALLLVLMSLKYMSPLLVDHMYLQVVGHITAMSTIVITRAIIANYDVEHPPRSKI